MHFSPRWEDEAAGTLYGRLVMPDWQLSYCLYFAACKSIVYGRLVMPDWQLSCCLYFAACKSIVWPPGDAGLAIMLLLL